MSSTEDLATEKICPTCNKQISGNFRLHCLMCERLKPCPICHERVQDLEEHISENHQTITCDMCHQEIDQSLFEKHQQEECPRRVVGICPYCEIELLAENKDGFYLSTRALSHHPVFIL